MVMKLLSKNPEDRYQNAQELIEDIFRCIESWKTAHKIESFPLGARDYSERFKIPQTLYGREKELELLQASFDRVIMGDVSQINSGNLILHQVKVEFSELVSLEIQNVLKSFGKPAELVEQRLEKGIVGFWDKNQIRKAVKNLLSNAVKVSG